MLQVKLYSFAATLDDAVSVKTVDGSFSWSAQINGGQGELKVKLNMPMSSIIDSDILRVFCTDQYNPSGKIVYTGVITKIWREMTKDSEYIEITALGLSALFGFKLFTNWAKTGGLSTILSDVIDFMNLSYNYFTKVISSLATTWNYDFQYKTVLDVINSVKQQNWSWTVDGQWNFIWKEKSTQTLHRFTMGNQIQRISIVDNAEQIKNKVTIGWSAWNEVYQDATSISNYGIRELYEAKTDITTAPYANTYGQWKALLAPSRTLTVQIAGYDIYSILPGHLITINNAPISIVNLQIYKITYGNNMATLEVEKIDSIGESVRN